MEEEHASLLRTYVTLVLLGTAVACTGKSGENASGGTPAAAVDTSHSVAASPSKSLRPPPPANPCSFNKDDGNHCAGLLRAGTPSWDDLKNARASLVHKLDSERRFNPMGKTFVNKDARNIYFDQMLPGQAILVGAIHYKEADQADVYYKAGNGLPPDDDLQTVFFVVERPASLPPSPAYGTAVAVWHLYGISGNPRVPKPIGNPGIMVECTHASVANSDLTKPNSYFGTCELIALADTAAAQVGYTQEKALGIMASHGIDKADTAARAAGKNQTMTSPAKSEEFLKMVARLMAKTQTGPYWFTCGLGCCTAETN